MMAPNKTCQGERHDARFVRDSRKPVLLAAGVRQHWRRDIRTGRVRVGGRISGRRPYDIIARHRGATAFRQSRPAVLCRERRRRGRQHRVRQVARVTPDGYTIMAISTAFLVNPSLYAKVPYDAIKDFAAVTLVAVSPNVVVVNPQVPAKTLPGLVQLIRDNPANTAMPPRLGSTPHLGAEQFRLTYKLDLVHVPFTAAAPAVQSTVGGHTPIAFTALPSSMAAIQAGRCVRSHRGDGALGASARRATFAEQGIKDQEADTLTASSPRRHAKGDRRVAVREIAKAVARPRQGAACGARLQAVAIRRGVHARIKLEMGKWGKVVHDANLRIE